MFRNINRFLLYLLQLLFGSGNLLANILRLVFLVLATLIGYEYGSRIFSNIDYQNPALLGSGIGLGIASTLLTAEIAFRHRFTRTLVTFMIGLAGGLILSALALLVMSLVIQSEQLRYNLDVPIALVIIYLTIMITLHNADRFRVVIPFVEFRARRVDDVNVVLDVSSLCDSRLPAIVNTGLLGYRMTTHSTVIRECQRLAVSEDLREQLRGKRALEYLNDLRLLPDISFELDASEVPRAKTSLDHVLQIARLSESRLVTADTDVATRARGEEVRVIDLSQVGRVLLPKVHVGDSIHIFLQRRGEESGQAVGYLNDGSMVVVENAGDQVGHEVTCTVMRMHHTTNGRMIFAESDL